MNLPECLRVLALPVIQAPMAGVQDEELAIAVSRAGGLGSVPCALLDARALGQLLGRIAPLALPINLNFFCHAMAAPRAADEVRWRTALAPYYRELGLELPAETGAGVRRPLDASTVDLLEPHRPQILSFHFGLPLAHLVQRIKAWGATILASATSLEEGRWLERNGADVVIAQGIEAGGHRGGFRSQAPVPPPSTRELVVQLRARLRVPVVAAGGIGDHGDVEVLLAAGACAVQAGTAYLLCREATTTAVHRAALERIPIDTALTNLFSGRPARGIVNRLMRDLGAMSDLPPPFPWASQALAPLRARAEAMGRDDFTPLWSGTVSCRFRNVDAAAITRSLGGAARESTA
ncbi:nitronate monooxygenase [Pseudoxanthomonas daejeonensis]|uniref:Propionate 3-nitronate monooxygenase n=1 Tax=Pseudoxanthomonas daejeonensis TaxID=266062 RepID=A0ABQ6ZBX1_9GAMM|nr:nitronate monooxygenase [Pseudoxanthomonas daejeonensis]KAF1697540.1 2-nitropropane dioxygenase [Pseudoxanthomonas daejeonensis]UNK58719.1 nitronate monooxygenase [Pseudoxanthomonas daejeonensis]